MKNPKIIPEWKKTLRYAWSIRLGVFAGLFSSLEVILTYVPDSLPRGTMAGLAGIASLGSVVTRFIIQKSMRDE